MPVEPKGCGIFLVGASKIGDWCFLWVGGHKLNVVIIELKKEQLLFSPLLSFHVKIYVNVYFVDHVFCLIKLNILKWF